MSFVIKVWNWGFIHVFPHQMAICFHICIWHLMWKNTFAIIKEPALSLALTLMVFGFNFCAQTYSDYPMVGFIYTFWSSLSFTSSILEYGFYSIHHLQMTSSEGFQQHFSIISKFVFCGFYMKKNVAYTLTLISFCCTEMR